MKDHTDNKPKGAEGVRGGRHGGFKKKNNKIKKPEPTTADKSFKGVAFSVGSQGPELYLKTNECLGLHTSTQLKNGLDVMKCILNEKLVKQKYLNLKRSTQLIIKRYGSTGYVNS